MHDKINVLVNNIINKHQTMVQDLVEKANKKEE